MKNTDISNYSDEGGVMILTENHPALSRVWGIVKRILLTVLLVGAITGVVVIISIVAYIIDVANEPFSLDLRNAKKNITSSIYVTNDDGTVTLDQNLYNTANRVWVDYNNIPKAMTDAVVSIEDKRFYDHKGVDWIRTSGAVLSLITGSADYGGSTITQQLVKNVTENDDVSLNRKITEIFHALDLEKQYTKEEILEAYLNIVNFGSGCSGVQAAANLYFDKDINECSIAECAAIAGITQNPAVYNPLAYPENNKKRREVVIGEMYSQGRITQSEYEAAMKESATMTFVGYSYNDDEDEDTTQSWYNDMLFREVSESLQKNLNISESEAERKLYTEGLKIYSAMDPTAQSIAQKKVLQWKTPKDKKLECGYIMMGLDGRVLATIGSRKEKDGLFLFDRANGAYLQPGSTIKPIAVYAPAIEDKIVNFSSLISDTAIQDWAYDANGNTVAGPNNWYEGYRGNITVMTALEISSNAATVNLLNQIGMRESYNYATNKFKLAHLDPDQDSKNIVAMSMGGVHGGTTVREMTASYIPFCNGGTYYEPYTYYYVTDQDNNIILDQRDKRVSSRAISEETAAIMNRLLHQVVSDKEGIGYRAAVTGWDIIGKTGTTDNTYDNWFVGASPYAVAGIWQGHDIPASINQEEEGKNHILWSEIMTEYLKTKEHKDFSIPDTVIPQKFCRETGLLANSLCPDTVMGYYTSDNMPGTCVSTHGKVITPPESSNTEYSRSDESSTSDTSDESSTESIESTESGESSTESTESIESVESSTESVESVIETSEPEQTSSTETR